MCQVRNCFVVLTYIVRLKLYRFYAWQHYPPGDSAFTHDPCFQGMMSSRDLFDNVGQVTSN